MICVTSGETLFATIQNRALAGQERWLLGWDTLSELVGEATGSSRFIRYLRGAVAIQAMRRLLRHWRTIKPEIGSENRYVPQLSKFIKSELFPGTDSDLVSTIARQTIQTDAASFAEIKKTTRAQVLRELAPTLSCYLCGQALSRDAKKGERGHLTLEHIWPTSLGGESVSDNLLPACIPCQKEKADAISWESISIHNLVLASRPSTNELRAVRRATKISRHYLAAIDRCTAERLRLKQAFLRIGPFSLSVESGREIPTTFFDLQTLEV